MSSIRVIRPLLLVVAGLTGCQAVQGSGPRMDNASSLSPETLPFDVVDLTPESVVAYRAVPIPQSISPVVPPAPKITIGVDDVLNVHIVERYTGGTFATLTQSNTLVVTRRVDANGTIDVPFVGAVSVAGRELPQIESDIAARLVGKANDPRVMVDLVTNRNNTVMVSGDVAKPGRLSLLDGQTLVEALNRAGGPASPAGQGQGGGGGGNTGTTQSDSNLVSRPASPLGGYGLSTSKAAINRAVISPNPKVLSDTSQLRVVVRRQNQVVFDKHYAEVLATGDFALQRNDEIVVSPASQVVTILGSVQKSGNLPIVKPDMNLADALGDSSGLIDQSANKTGVYVFRPPHSQFNRSDRGRIFRLDLGQPVSIFVARQFAVHPNDVIYVANAPLYEYDKVLTPLFQTFSAVNAVRRQ
jgi:polysaccharide biosynthesis/export protein